GKLHLAAKNMYIDRIGITETKQIKYNGLHTSHAFEVMELEDNIELYIGSDLLPKLGIFLQGVAHKWDEIDNSTEKKIDLESGKDVPTPNNSPYSTPEERNKLLQAIQPFLDENQNISKTSACTVPESIVLLPRE
ncbi:hypothetical protein BDB00DRAFT_746257, partial [Zychaea mexicana]|uniref:uncharacterized protein n=1 Tax=Zychaea mexicana TaxID=64656 RepID=UPI0022FEC137